MDTGGTLREYAAGEIRAHLARRRISAAELARRLGWAQSYMARRIDGRVALDLDDLERIAAALGLNVRDLLPRPEEGRVVRAVGAGITTAYAPAAGSVEQSSRTADSGARRTPHARTPGPSGARPDRGPAGRAGDSATRRPVRTSPRRARLTA